MDGESTATMTTRRGMEIGLTVGAALGLFVRGSVVHAPGPEMEVRDRPEVAAAHDIRQARQPDFRLWLVDKSRAWLRDPAGDYQSAWLERVDFRGADLREADLRQARIARCDFTGANLEHADLTDAVYDRFTRWPEGFDPREHGARLDR